MKFNIDLSDIVKINNLYQVLAIVALALLVIGVLIARKKLSKLKELSKSQLEAVLSIYKSLFKFIIIAIAIISILILVKFGIEHSEMKRQLESMKLAEQFMYQYMTSDKNNRKEHLKLLQQSIHKYECYENLILYATVIYTDNLDYSEGIDICKRLEEVNKTKELYLCKGNLEKARGFSEDAINSFRTVLVTKAYYDDSSYIDCCALFNISSMLAEQFQNEVKNKPINQIQSLLDSSELYLNKSNYSLKYNADLEGRFHLHYAFILKLRSDSTLREKYHLQNAVRIFKDQLLSSIYAQPLAEAYVNYADYINCSKSKTRNLDSALQFVEMAKDIFTKSKNYRHLGFSCTTKGEIYHNMQNRDAACKSFEEASTNFALAKDTQLYNLVLSMMNTSCN